MIKLSVIIPVYNGEKIIDKTLTSLVEQSLPLNEYEIIVVDDGSTDGSQKIIKKFQEKYPFIILLIQKNLGPAVARNRGADKAKGKILIFTDSDCIADRNFIENMLAPFTDKEIAGVQGVYRTKQKALIARFAQIEIEERYKRMRKNRYIDFIGSYAAAYKKSVFLSVKGFNENFPIASGEDSDLSFRIANAGYKMVLSEKAIVYHQHPETLRKYLKQKYGRAVWRNLIYKENLKKTLRDSYTTTALKLQILILPFIYFFAILSFKSLCMRLPLISQLPLLFNIQIFNLTTKVFLLCSTGLLLFSILFIISMIPFIIFSIKKDKLVALISPIVIILRTHVFIAGLFVGFFKVFIFKRK